MSGQREQRRRTERIAEKGRYQLQCFEKAWYKCFFTHHNLIKKDDVAAVDHKKSLGSIEEKLPTFLQASNSLSSSCKADKVKRYCEGISLEKVQNGVGEGGTRLAA
jgi:hypothetical protein